jgi:hypothetical protein
MDFALIQKFRDRFGGMIFHEDPGDRVIYEKDDRCYALPENYLEIMKRSLVENKDLLLEAGKEIEYDSDSIY